jgi:hypothetical protein
MATQLKELNDVGPVLRAPDFALVLEDGEARESESDNRLKLGGLEGSTQKSIKLLSHACCLLNENSRRKWPVLAGAKGSRSNENESSICKRTKKAKETWLVCSFM